MILVTGGAGFIGSNFVLHWLATRDEPVLNLDALTYAGHLENLEALSGDPRHLFVRGDVCDAALVDGLMALHRPRAVLHFAAESHVDQSIRGPAAFVRTNVEGSFVVLEAARRHWSALNAQQAAAFRFVQVSTDEVYGSLGPLDPAFGESHPYRPNNPYSASKAASDHLARAWHRTYGLPVIVTHCSNNFGPQQLPEKLIPLTIANALAGRPLPLYGDGLHVRDWLYVADHCRALCRVLDDGQPGAVYNIGGGNERSNRETVEAVCALLDEWRPGRDGPRAGLIRFVPDRPGHDRRYAIDAGKMRRELGWRPAESFESGLRKTVRWYLDHPDWVSRVQIAAQRGRQERQIVAPAAR